MLGVIKLIINGTWTRAGLTTDEAAAAGSVVPTADAEGAYVGCDQAHTQWDADSSRTYRG